MEIELADVSGLPDALKAFVAEKDGKSVLNLGGAAEELVKSKGKALTAQQEAIDRRKALDAWTKLGESPDAVSAKLSQGADPKIIDQMRAAHAQEVGAWKDRFTATVRNAALAGLKAELSKAGVVPEGLDLLATYAATRMAFDDEGNVRIMAQGGTPMVGAGKDGGATLADLAAELAKSIPHLVADKGAGGSGKLAGSNGGTPGKKTVTRAQWDGMSHVDRAAFIKTGGKVVD